MQLKFEREFIKDYQYSYKGKSIIVSKDFLLYLTTDGQLQYTIQTHYKFNKLNCVFHTYYHEWRVIGLFKLHDCNHYLFVIPDRGVPAPLQPGVKRDN